MVASTHRATLAALCAFTQAGAGDRRTNTEAFVRRLDFSHCGYSFDIHYQRRIDHAGAHSDRKTVPPASTKLEPFH